MENIFDKNDWVFDADDLEPITEEVVVDEVVEEPVVEKVAKEEVVEKKPVEEVAKKKSSKGDVVIYSLKDMTFAGVDIVKGYSKVSKNVVDDLLKHPKIRLASEEEISTYWRA